MFNSICTFAQRFSPTFPIGYIGYFVLGYELRNIHIKRTIIVWILAAISIVSVACITILTHFVSLTIGDLTESFYDYLSPAVVLYSSCLYLLAKILLQTDSSHYNRWYSKPIVLMSKYSLGIYMFHEFVLILVQKFGVNPTMCHPLIAVPVIAIGIYFSSFLVIHICSKLPVFKKYMM